jgi:hypothetical protein
MRLDIIRLTENSNNPILNRIRDLPACRVVPEPTTLQRAHPKRMQFLFLCSEFGSHPLCGYRCITGPVVTSLTSS